MNRKQWIFDHLITAWTTFLHKREQIEITAEQAFDVVCAADPSQNKSAVQWIIKAYMDHGFLWEDLQGGQTSKVFQTLELFGMHKKHLPQEKRNLYKYSTLASVYSSVQRYHLTDLEQIENSNRLELKGQKLKRLEKETALSQSHMLVDQQNFKIAIPLTKEAAQWWGKGTQWCTGAQNNNQFDHYNKSAPLIVLSFKDSLNQFRKIQLWVTKDSFQFMDETDAPVEIGFVEQNWNNFEAVIHWAFEINPSVIKYFPKNLITDCMYMEAFEKDSVCFEFLPERLKTVETCTQAVDKNGYCLRWVPEPLKTYKMCMQALGKNILSFDFVPARFYSEELYLKAVEFPNNLADIKDPSFELCLQAVKFNSLALWYIPQKFKNQDFYSKALEVNVDCFRGIPDNFKTYKMCLKAVKETNTSFVLVPNEFCTQELCYFAVQTNHRVIEFVPPDIINEAMCSSVVQKDGNLLKHVPEKFKTSKVCWEAVQQTGIAINLVPKNLITDDMCLMAIQTYGRAIELLNFEKRTLEICWKSVEQDGYSLRWVPEHMQTQEMCITAAKNNCKSVSFINKKFLNDEINDILTDAIKNVKTATDVLDGIWNNKSIQEWTIEQTQNSFNKTLDRLETDQVFKINL